MGVATSELQAGASVSGSISALGGVFEFSLEDFASASIQVWGTFVGTLVFEVRNGDDPAIPWVSKTEGVVTPTGGSVSTVTTPQVFGGDIGEKRGRLRATAWTSGEAKIEVELSRTSRSASKGTQSVTSAGQVSEDASVSSGASSALIAGVRRDAISAAETSAAGDAGNVTVDRHGAQVTRSIDSMKRTYATAVKLSGAAVITGTILEILGSATAGAVVEINRLTVTLNGTAAGKLDFALTKRSSAFTGGTSTTPAKVPYDSADAAAGATVKVYSVAPTGAGASVGAVRQGMLSCGANVPSDRMRLESGTYAKSITLLGAAQGLTLELAGTVPAGAEVSIDVEWTEY